MRSATGVPGCKLAIFGGGICRESSHDWNLDVSALKAGLDMQSETLNIVEILKIGDWNGYSYYTMEKNKEWK